MSQAVRVGLCWCKRHGLPATQTSAAAVDSRRFLPSAASIPPQAVRAQEQPSQPAM